MGSLLVICFVLGVVGLFVFRQPHDDLDPELTDSIQDEEPVVYYECDCSLCLLDQHL